MYWKMSSSTCRCFGAIYNYCNVAPYRSFIITTAVASG